MKDLYAGLDLGQAQDYTALAVSEARDVPTGYELEDHYTERGKRWQTKEQQTEIRYALRHAKRWDLGTDYPEIVEDVRALMLKLRQLGDPVLVVDATGVGRPVLDMLGKADLSPKAVWITGGDSVNQNGSEYRVPKQDLATNLQGLVQARRLRFASDIEYLDALKKEMQTFSAKIDRETGHVSYEHLRESDKDDLVLALAIGVWYAEYRRRKPQAVEPIKTRIR